MHLIYVSINIFICKIGIIVIRFAHLICIVICQWNDVYTSLKKHVTLQKWMYYGIRIYIGLTLRADSRVIADLLHFLALMIWGELP